MTGLRRRQAHQIDLDVPHPARMNDYWMGGRHNFAADRELAEDIAAAIPGIGDVAWLNQAAIRRAVLFLVESGIHQFLDIGSGSLAVGTTYDVVQQATPDSHFVYVDSDPMTIAYRELMLQHTEGATVIEADVRDAAGILNRSSAVLDVDRPIGLIAPMLHFIPDSWDPAGILADYRDRLASGSYLAMLHLTSDPDLPGLAAAQAAYQRTHYRVHPRSYQQILDLCAGFELVEPGLVGFAHWRPERTDQLSANPGINSLIYVAVGRKP
jgi:hypothetical protein